jgi:TRAP-type uncharacterized transport system substrate-binding protein
MDIETITIIILGLMLLIYTCNDYVIPFLTGTQASNMLESFTSQYSSLESSLAALGSPASINHSQQTAAFDTNWYLRDPHHAIIRSNKVSLPIISYGFYENGSYDDLVGTYFRHHIYPIEPQQLATGLDTIYKFINGDIDVAFINEELLTRFIKQDCKYLTRYIIDQLGLESYDLSQPDNISRLYHPINFSALGVGYHVHPFLIVNNFSNIREFLDIKDKSIGVLEDSYYYFMKIAAAYQLDISSLDIPRHLHLEELLDNFQTGKYDGVFILAHPKNKQLLKLTLNMKVRFIHIQKHQSLADARSNLANLIPDQQGTNNKAPPPPPDMNRQQIYSKTLMDDLGSTGNPKESFNSFMRKYFHHLEPITINLNKFHKSGNMYSYLETYSTRMVLCVRNDIPSERQTYITRNYIDNLNKVRDRIDREEFVPQLDNFSSTEFAYEELLGFDKVIPLATGAREVYKDEGLIYFEDDARCRV